MKRTYGIRHRIAHWFGWNLGTVVAWRQGDECYVGFKCGTCGKVSGAEILLRSVSTSAAPK